MTRPVYPDEAAETIAGLMAANEALRAEIKEAESERVKAVDALTRVEEALADKTDELADLAVDYDAVIDERDCWKSKCERAERELTQAIAALQRKP